MPFNLNQALADQQPTTQPVSITDLRVTQFYFDSRDLDNPTIRLRVEYQLSGGSAVRVSNVSLRRRDGQTYLVIDGTWEPVPGNPGRAFLVGTPEESLSRLDDIEKALFNYLVSRGKVPAGTHQPNET